MKNSHVPNHVMIDLETMGTRADSAIVSIGAVVFDPRLNKVGKRDTKMTFYTELDWEFDQDRHICPDTANWWSKQSVEARSALNGLDSLDTSLVELANWLPKDVKVWGNGAIFDIGMLENAYQQYGIPIPWKFWNVRDCRTVKDMYESARGGWDGKVGGVAHNALDDALHQAQYICKMWTSLLEVK